MFNYIQVIPNKNSWSSYLFELVSQSLRRLNPTVLSRRSLNRTHPSTLGCAFFFLQSTLSKLFVSQHRYNSLLCPFSISARKKYRNLSIKQTIKSAREVEGASKVNVRSNSQIAKMAWDEK